MYLAAGQAIYIWQLTSSPNIIHFAANSDSSSRRKLQRSMQLELVITCTSTQTMSRTRCVVACRSALHNSQRKGHSKHSSRTTALQQQLESPLIVRIPLPLPLLTPPPELCLHLLHSCPLRNSRQECSQGVPAHCNPCLLIGMDSKHRLLAGHGSAFAQFGFDTVELPNGMLMLLKQKGASAA